MAIWTRNWVAPKFAVCCRFCGHELGNLRCPGYCNIRMTDATWTKARKLAAFLS